MAGLAAVTTRLRLGDLVSPATFRHPSVLAKLVTAADHISNGRVELGIGAGWNEREHEAVRFRVPAARRAHGAARGAARRSCAAPGPTARSPSRASTTGSSTSTRSRSRCSARTAADHRRRRQAAHRAARRSARRRVQHGLRDSRRVRRAARGRRGGVARRGPRSGDADVLGHGAVVWSALTPPICAGRAGRLAEWRGTDADSLLEEFAGLGVDGHVRRGARPDARATGTPASTGSCSSTCCTTTSRRSAFWPASPQPSQAATATAAKRRPMAAACPAHSGT